ncbi:MAG: hypothetical protein K5745_05670 [Saccharofermentans sp.]|nr:hypothetical protein [Saccharofermentans sp.]
MAEKKRSFWSFVSDYKRNTVLLALPSIPFDIIYGTFCFFVGVFTLSLWLVVMSFYHFLICAMRTNILYRAGRGKITGEKRFSERKNYQKSSRNLILFDLILALAINFIYKNRIEHDYPGVILYIFIAYVTYKVILSLINIFRAHRSQSLTTVSLRKVGILDAIVSLLILQWALVRTKGTIFSDISQSVEAYIGIVAIVIIFLLGVSGLIKCHKLKKQERLQISEGTGN